MFVDHAVRRQLYLVDKPGDHNDALATAVDDAVATVEALLAEGRTVVVHCHGGRSRTGLVLKAWKMRTDGCSEPEAHDWLEAQWPLARKRGLADVVIDNRGKPADLPLQVEKAQAWIRQL